MGKNVKSPFDKRISDRQVYKAVAQYHKISGNTITFDLEKPGKIGLYVLEKTGARFIGRFPNWEAFVMINDLTARTVHNQRFKVPGPAVRPALFATG